MVRVHRLGQDRRPHLRGRPHPPRASGKLEARPRLFQRAQVDPDDLPRDGPLPALERPRAQGRLVLAPDDHRASSPEPPARGALAHPRGNLEHAPRRKSRPQAPPAYLDRAKIATDRSRRARIALANPGGSPDAAKAKRRKSLVGRNHLQETQAGQVRNRDAAVAGRDGLLPGRARLRSGSRQGRSHRQQPAHRARGQSSAGRLGLRRDDRAARAAPT